MSTYNICFHGEITKIVSFYPLLSGAMLFTFFNLMHTLLHNRKGTLGFTSFMFALYWPCFGNFSIMIKWTLWTNYYIYNRINSTRPCDIEMRYNPVLNLFWASLHNYASWPMFNIDPLQWHYKECPRHKCDYIFISKNNVMLLNKVTYILVYKGMVHSYR